MSRKTRQELVDYYVGRGLHPLEAQEAASIALGESKGDVVDDLPASQPTG